MRDTEEANLANDAVKKSCYYGNHITKCLSTTSRSTNAEVARRERGEVSHQVRENLQLQNVEADSLGDNGSDLDGEEG